MEKLHDKNENTFRKQILELGPLVLFFIGNYFLGILWGTAILVVTTLISISISWLLEKENSLDGCVWLRGSGILWNTNSNF